MRTACKLSHPNLKSQIRLTITSLSWFVVGQIFASVALNQLHALNPLDFRTPIYTQVKVNPFQQVAVMY